MQKERSSQLYPRYLEHAATKAGRDLDPLQNEAHKSARKNLCRVDLKVTFAPLVVPEDILDSHRKEEAERPLTYAERLRTPCYLYQNRWRMFEKDGGGGGPNRSYLQTQPPNRPVLVKALRTKPKSRKSSKMSVILQNRDAREGQATSTPSSSGQRSRHNDTPTTSIRGQRSGLLPPSPSGPSEPASPPSIPPYGDLSSLTSDETLAWHHTHPQPDVDRRFVDLHRAFAEATAHMGVVGKLKTPSDDGADCIQSFSAFVESDISLQSQDRWSPYLPSTELSDLALPATFAPAVGSEESPDAQPLQVPQRQGRRRLIRSFTSWISRLMP